VDCIIHHLPAAVIFAVLFAAAGCLVLIWLPANVNELTLGLWTRGVQIDTPTPAFLIAMFGWAVLLAMAIAIFIGLHREP
jgi:hypothetical protein